MDEDPVKGWVFVIQRRKGQRFDRFYVAIADQKAGRSALGAKLRLTSEALVELREGLTARDVATLNLNAGQISKV